MFGIFVCYLVLSPPSFPPQDKQHLLEQVQGVDQVQVVPRNMHVSDREVLQQHEQPEVELPPIEDKEITEENQSTKQDEGQEEEEEGENDNK